MAGHLLRHNCYGNISGGDPASEDAAAQSNLPTHGSEWVELLVSEMMNASDMDGAQGRASRVLEAFEKSVASRASAEAAEHFHQKVLCILVVSTSYEESCKIWR